MSVRLIQKVRQEELTASEKLELSRFLKKAIYLMTYKP